MKPLISLFLLAAPLAGAQSLPKWLEPDSMYAISYRIDRDFPYTIDDLRKKLPDLPEATFQRYVREGYLESLEVNGVQKFHRKAPGNYKLLAPELSGFKGRGSTASPKRIAYVDSVIAESRGDGVPMGGHRVTFRFSIDVPTVDALRGDTLRVWMPVPMTTTRQPEVKILSSFPENGIVSTTDRSVHNTIYFTQPVGDKSTHFEYTATYVAKPQYFSPEYIRKNIRPYDKNSELYKKYTTFEGPNIVKTPLAYTIVGNEKDPYRCSEMVYDYIIANFPWAGAREYSTIPCIPEYVCKTGHGDCGQVAMLYISIMRTLGIPARWESGWMIHPGEVNLHDWAEVYFEGVGWVPVDASFGRYTSSPNVATQKFYSTGMDKWRMAANTGINGAFYPEKRFIRSETVDSQMGEVESSRGNLFYPGWNMNFEIISIEPLK